MYTQFFIPMQPPTTTHNAKELHAYRERERAAQAEKEDLRQYKALAAEYPELREIPPEVAQRIAQGETPLSAYRAYELQQLRQKLTVLEKTQENKEKSPGSVAGNTPTEEGDSFLNAFDAAFR